MKKKRLRTMMNVPDSRSRSNFEAIEHFLNTPPECVELLTEGGKQLFLTIDFSGNVAKRLVLSQAGSGTPTGDTLDEIAHIDFTAS